MFRLLMLGMTVAVTGCASVSSEPKVVDHRPQYCHTSQEILLSDGQKVKSHTQVSCTDDQIKRVTTKRLGISPHCGEFTYWMQLGGRNVQKKGISCQKPDGSWEVVNTTQW